MALPKERITVDEYERIIAAAENANRRLELINGEIIEKMPTQLHALIVHLINGFLFVFLREHPAAWAFPEARYQLPEDPDNSFIPDISVVRREGKTITEQGAATYMPDLAIEVQSPGQGDKFMLDKAWMYLNRGTKMVWIVYPEKRVVEVLTPTERHLLTVNHTLTGGDILPGFTLAIREIFPSD
ncbi:MAG: Uma2 family endonuclease [Anaerolinea sp.]|nr:Uma2 family endonuclease [Anaerolinea sp.]